MLAAGDLPGAGGAEPSEAGGHSEERQENEPDTGCRSEAEEGSHGEVAQYLQEITLLLDRVSQLAIPPEPEPSRERVAEPGEPHDPRMSRLPRRLRQCIDGARQRPALALGPDQRRHRVGVRLGRESISLADLSAQTIRPAREIVARAPIRSPRPSSGSLE